MKQGRTSKRSLQQVTWKDVREEVAAVNPGLAQVIDDLDPSDEFKLYKASYAYGDHALYRGSVYIPSSEGQLVHVRDSQIDQTIVDDLCYAETVPMGLVLKNNLELYLSFNQHPVPFALMQPGHVFALWSVLDLPAIYQGRMWSITSGARSLYILPKITDVIGYKRIKQEFGLKTLLPKKYINQWELFREIANHPDFSDPWHSEVLFFSGKWLENKEDTKWKLFRLFLLESAWKKAAFLRLQIIFDSAFSHALRNRNLKPNPYLTDTVKHLYMLGAGYYPGFKVTDDNFSGPIERLQKIFSDIYSLKYSPTILSPGYINENPIYYLLTIPTLRQFAPRSKKGSTKREDLQETKHVKEVTNAEFLEDKLGLQQTPLYEVFEKANYKFYHTEIMESDGIKSTHDMVQSDELLADEINRFKKPFCASSPFIRGCVSISRKKK